MSIVDMPAAAASQRRRRPARRLFAVAAAVVVLAAGGTYLGVRLSSGTGPPTSGLATMWTRDIKTQQCIMGAAGQMPWVTNGLAVVCTGPGTLTAYQVGTGRVAWTWRAPGKQIFGMSADTDDGIGVVEVDNGNGPNGEDLVGLDAASGRELWQLPNAWPAGSAIWEGGGDFLASAGSDNANAVQADNLATGAVDWSSASSNVPPAGCDMEDTAITGPWVYAVASCSGGADRIYQMSLQTGSVIAQATLQDGACKAAGNFPTLWAAAGYILSGCSGAPKAIMESPDVLIIRAGGVQQRSLPWAFTGANDFITALGQQLSPPDIAIGGNTLYVQQGATAAGGTEIYKLAAINLSNARLRWYKTISIPGANPTNTAPVNVIGGDSGRLFDVIQSIGGTSDAPANAITLATISASNGTISYGPGSTSTADGGVALFFILDGNVLLSFPLCTDSCDITGSPIPSAVTAYSLGSWPG